MTEDEVRVIVEEREQHLRGILDSQGRRILYLEHLVDTYMDSPVWKRVWFWIDGWPADRISSEPRSRLWRR